MKSALAHILAGFCAVFSAFSAASAQDSETYQDVVRENMQRNPIAFLDLTENYMRMADPDGTISAKSIERFRQATLANWHAHYLGAFLRADLNFDGMITPEELPPHHSYARLMLLDALKAADTDLDGTYSNLELRSAALSAVESNARVQGKLEDIDEYKELMIFDLDADGSVTVAEMRQGAMQLVAE